MCPGTGRPLDDLLCLHRVAWWQEGLECLQSSHEAWQLVGLCLLLRHGSWWVCVHLPCPTHPGMAAVGLLCVCGPPKLWSNRQVSCVWASFPAITTWYGCLPPLALLGLVAGGALHVCNPPCCHAVWWRAGVWASFPHPRDMACPSNGRSLDVS